MILKTAILFVLLAIFAATFAGCGGSAENTETANANTAENPFANLTDANQALAEGNRLLDEDRIELAVQAFTQAVNLNPDLAEAWFKLGIGYSLLEMAAQQAGTSESPGFPDRVCAVFIWFIEALNELSGGMAQVWLGGG